MGSHERLVRGLVAWGVLVLAAGCPQGGSGAKLGGAKKAGTPVAHVGDTVITVEDLDEKINAQGPFAKPRFQDVAKRREFLDGLVRQEVLAQEAVRRGYMEDPEVVDALKKVMVQKLTRQEYDSLVKQEDIKAEDVKKYYDEHPDEFHKPEMVRCAAVIIQQAADPVAARKRAQDALKQVQEAAAKKPDPTKPMPPDTFRDVVMALSDDAETKALGGDLKYLTRKELDEKYGEAVGAACFDLANVNDVSGVVEGKGAYLVLKNTGRRKAIDRTLEQVEGQIRNRLFREKRTEAFNAFVDKLKSQAKVRVDEEKLAAMKISASPATPGPPPAMPGGGPGHDHGGHQHAPGLQLPPGTPAAPGAAPAAQP
jgi:hypothetical protein